MKAKTKVKIDWTKQICGVHQATYPQLIELMPDLKDLIDTFPENPSIFIWNVKVHMLMPGQYPCIPNWHYDNIPRINNVQDFSRAKPHLPMYLWVSNQPLPEFRNKYTSWFIQPETWTRFTQQDEHRGSVSDSFCWRGFIRATGLFTKTKNRKSKS